MDLHVASIMYRNIMLSRFGNEQEHPPFNCELDALAAYTELEEHALREMTTKVGARLTVGYAARVIYALENLGLSAERLNEVLYGPVDNALAVPDHIITDIKNAGEMEGCTGWVSNQIMWCFWYGMSIKRAGKQLVHVMRWMRKCAFVVRQVMLTPVDNMLELLQPGIHVRDPLVRYANEIRAHADMRG